MSKSSGQKRPGSTHSFEEWAELFGVLADPNRLRLLIALHDNPQVHVGALAERAGMSMTAASHALGVLRKAGIVERERDGQRIQYSLADALATEMLDRLRR